MCEKIDKRLCLCGFESILCFCAGKLGYGEFPRGTAGGIRAVLRRCGVVFFMNDVYDWLDTSVEAVGNTWYPSTIEADEYFVRLRFDTRKSVRYSTYTRAGVSLDRQCFDSERGASTSTS